MTLAPCRGTALRTYRIRTRFAPIGIPGPRPDAKLTGRVVEVRKLLRTELSVDEIAEQLGVDPSSLRNFIKRRQLCNLKERRDFITLQASLRKQP